MFFSYIANNYYSVHENDNIEFDNLSLTKYQDQQALENNLNVINDALVNSTVDGVENMSEEKIEIKVENDDFKKPIQNVEISNLNLTNQHSSNSVLINIPVQVCI